MTDKIEDTEGIDQLQADGAAATHDDTQKDKDNLTGADDDMGSKRERKPTERGKEYQIDIKRKELKRTLSSWKREANQTWILMEDCKDFELLKQRRQWLIVEIGQAQSLLEELCTLEENEDARRRYEDIETEHYQLLKEINTTIKCYQQDIAHSQSSRRSVKSTASAASLRAAAAAEAAAAETKLKYLHVESAAKAELERIQAEKELGIARAKLAAVDEAAGSGSIRDRESLAPDGKQLHLDRYISELNAHAEEFRPGEHGVEPHQQPPPQAQVQQPQRSVQGQPKPQLNQGSSEHLGSPSEAGADLTASLTRMLAQQLELSRLPPPEPVIFRGDPIKYPGWKASFEMLIESKRIPAPERLHYLSRYLAGEPRDCIESFLILQTEEAYNDAKSLLDNRYGDQFEVANAFRRKLDCWTRISPKDGASLRKFADFLQQCLTAMQSISMLKILDDVQENQKLLKKLPDWMVTRWGREALQHRQKHGSYPTFKHFVNFVKDESEVVCDPITSLQALRGTDDPQPKGTRSSKSSDKKIAGSRTLATQAKETASETKKKQEFTPRPCWLCSETSHQLDSCPKFLAKPLEERKKYIQDNRLCFGCLRKGHRLKDCQRRSRCSTCKRRHPTSLHEEQPTPSNKDTKELKNDTPPDASVTSRKVHLGNSICTSMVVPVWVSAKDQSEVLTYALLDTQSDASFILEDLAETLQADQSKVKLKVTTMTSPSSSVEAGMISSIQLRGMNEKKTVKLNKCYTSQAIPVDRRQIPSRKVAESWDHLRGIARQLPPIQDCEVGLLIGYNCPQALAPREVVTGEESQPYAVRTDLGWSVVGGSDEEGQVSFCHRIFTKESPDISPSDVLQILQSDFVDTKEGESPMSQEDLKFIQLLEEGIAQEDGHLIMPLPFKNGPPVLPDNRKSAENRLSHLKKKLQRDPVYKERYTKFIEDVLEKNEAEEVTSEGTPGKVWYIPHHGVYHPRKPQKLRVVFDCSAKHQGDSLNSHLLTGPDLLNTLTGVLWRFRQHPVAVQADIERMFHQFLVDQEHRDYLRFLWWEKGNLDSTPKVYRMKVHLFGATSSPGCANFALKYLATHMANEYPHAESFIHRNFYVDDGLQSCKDEEEAITVVKESQEVCSSAKIRLHKFVSNSESVMESIDPADRGTNLKDVELGGAPTESVLGIRWRIWSDTLTFASRTIQDNPTRRGILSAVAQVFDPLGLLAPVILEGKILLQSLCKEGVGWDDELPSHLKTAWSDWKTNCENLHKVDIKRCLRPDFSIERTELHHFADASTRGYGQCSYLRFLGRESVHCSLIGGKARVAPLKSMTVPRLELTAAVVSALMSEKVKKELDIDIDAEYYWTDSQVVLSYITNESKRFHVFVANRVERIRQLSSPDQWFHVATTDNPADLASRGTSISGLLDSCWFQGPKFLWNRSWEPPAKESSRLKEDDPEVRKTVSLGTRTAETHRNLMERLSVFSDWTKMLRAIARLKRAARRDHGGSGRANYQEQLEAEKFLIREVQREAFKEEIQDLESGEHVKATSTLKSLNPFLGEDGVLRVGGRLRNAKIADNIKHPAILPKKGPITQALLRHHHQRIKHQGRGYTLNEVRVNGYWILGGSKAVAEMIKKCVTCRKLRRPLEEQKMADLPQDRVEPSPPFTSIGIDCFGPFRIKRGRSEFKRYGLLFTCLCSRAVHIEMLEDMSADSFINALRCFIALRGPIKTIRCDQGSNFIGADNELKAALGEMNQEKVKEYLQDCEFIYNAPHASHAGGVWERQIRSIRNVLRVTIDLCPGRLDDASLRTLLYEAMAIVNSRPLTPMDLSDPLAEPPLTPNHILTMKSTTALPPPGNFVREDMFIRKRWRRVQYLLEQFWSRWQKEYLLNLQQREKWKTPRRNLKVGDVVLLKEDSLPRLDWPLARVSSVKTEEDGLVRRAEVEVGSRTLDQRGRRNGNLTTLERPIQKLVLLVEAP